MSNVAIIGSGPAGLQAAIFTASEGLSTTIYEGGASLGGQIGDTPMFENIIGQNRNGVSGHDFIKNAIGQCSQFGVRFQMEKVKHILPTIDGKWSINAQYHDAVILAVGQRYKNPPPEQCGHDRNTFIGPYQTRNVKRIGYYCVVGCGNAAGQAILDLASHALQVTVIKHSTSGMSQYLTDRILKQKNVLLVENTDVKCFDGKYVYCHNDMVYPADYIFFCLGTVPNTEFLSDELVVKENGLICVDESFQCIGPHNGKGLYAIGDCRKGVRRRSVAAAIGDAANATAYVLKYIRG